MRHLTAVPAFALSLAAAGADAVNRGDMPTVFAAFTPSPTIVEDLAPYRWQGQGTPQAWIEGMGANAQAHGITTINMKLAPPTRTLKDGHSEHADGLITVLLQQAGADWKIDTLVWSGPQAKR